MTPTAGNLNRRVVYQEPAAVADSYGDVSGDHADVAAVWAEVRTPTGRELVSAGQTLATVSHAVTVRRAKGWFPSPLGRFLYSSPAYNPAPRYLNVVAAFDPDESNRFVTCLCLERAEPTDTVS